LKYKAVAHLRPLLGNVSDHFWSDSVFTGPFLTLFVCILPPNVLESNLAFTKLQISWHAIRKELCGVFEDLQSNDL
jgi:hypothetical protein